MAGLYAGVFAALSAATLGLMVYLFREEARQEVEEALNREQLSLIAAYDEQGIDGVTHYAQSLRLRPLGERWSLVLDGPQAHIQIPSNGGAENATDRDVVTRDVVLAPQVRAQLRVGMQAEREAVRLLGRALATGVVALVALALAGGVLLSWFTNRRISQMDRALAGIIAGDLSSRLPVRHTVDDELDRLAANVNHALDRVQQLMTSVRSATDGIAHDLRTPLARHRSRIEQALMEPPTRDQLGDWLEQARVEVDGILATFQGLLQVATVEAGTLRSQFADVDLSALAAAMMELYEPSASERGLLLRGEIAPTAVVKGMRDLLNQSLANLLDNAIKYSPPGAEVIVAVEALADEVQLSVRDTGPGIPEAERERVFQRLYRLDASRSTPGLGLGLSLVKAVAELHHGEARVEPVPSGARVVIRLPKRPD
jgi:signal transduction histidine kinase